MCVGGDDLSMHIGVNINALKYILEKGDTDAL